MDWTVEDHLRDQPEASVELYRDFVRLVQACGPFGYTVARTTITFKGSRRGFAGARRTVEDPRIRSVAPYTTRLYVHQFRIGTAAELDAEFAGWVREAYAVGAGEHLTAGG